MKNNLPAGWAWAKVSELSQTLRGVSYKKGDEQRTPTHTNCLVLRGGNIQNGKVVPVDDNIYVDKSLVLEKQLLQEGDVVIVSSTGSVRLIGKAAAVLENTDNVSFGAFLSMLRPKAGIDEKLFGYFFQSAFYRNAIRELAAGININNIRNQYLEDLDFPLPPLAEQRRIVTQLDAIVQKLEASQERLDKLPDLLKKFRQAVLAAAVSGKLTEAWRAEQPQSETGSDLLNRIRAKRRNQWEEKQRAKLFGKQLNLNDSWKHKYEEPAAPDILELPELPEGWVWARLDLLAEVKGGITKDSKQREGTRLVPYLRVANVQRGFLDLSEVKEIEASEEAINELKLLRGDILFNEGGDRDKLGRGWIWENQVDECIHQNHVFRARTYSNEMQAKLLSWWGNTFGKDYFMRQGKQSTNLASINISKLGAFPVFVAPPNEQQEIVRQVEHYFSLADQLEARFDQAAAMVEQLPQALLAKAFSGQLVTQDPNDEPASVLLERLRAPQATPAAPTKGKRGRKAEAPAEAPLFD